MPDAVNGMSVVDALGETVITNYSEVKPQDSVHEFLRYQTVDAWREAEKHDSSEDQQARPDFLCKPLHGRLFVDEDQTPLSTSSGIALPEGMKGSFRFGYVVAVADGWVDYGVHTPTSLQVGDYVAFAEKFNDSLVIGGKKYLMMKEGNVVAILRHKGA